MALLGRIDQMEGTWAISPAQGTGKNTAGAMTRRTLAAAGLENQFSRKHSDSQVGKDRPPDF